MNGLDLTAANCFIKNLSPPLPMQKLTKRIMLLLATSLILSACGTKGPLYIPEKMYPQPTETKQVK